MCYILPHGTIIGAMGDLGRHAIENEELYQRELKVKLEGVEGFGDRQKVIREQYGRHTLPIIEKTRFELLSVLAKEVGRLLRIVD